MNFFKNSIVLIFIIAAVFSCQNDDSSAIDNPDDVTEPTDPSADTSLTNEVDRKFFEQLKTFGDIYAKKEFIDDYGFINYPMYFIIKASDGKFEKGFVMNPISEINDAIKLGTNENLGLDIYRLDTNIDAAVTALSNGNGLYDFNFSIEGKNNYYVQIYTEEGTKGLNGLSDVTTAAHEAFHDFYQTKDGATNSDWEFAFNGIQDQDNFPTMKELLELQILNTEILKELPNSSDISVITNIMKQYVAIKSKELEIDPSAQKLILNMEIEQERLEGSAHYVEILGRREFSVLNVNDPYYEGFGISALDSEESFFTPEKGHLPLTFTIDSKSSLQDVMGFSIAYPVGASVIYGISKIDREKVKLIKTQTPYAIISNILNLSDSDKNEALEAAKNSVDWTAIQDRATVLSNLN